MPHCPTEGDKQKVKKEKMWDERWSGGALRCVKNCRTNLEYSHNVTYYDRAIFIREIPSRLRTFHFVIVHKESIRFEKRGEQEGWEGGNVRVGILSLSPQWTSQQLQCQPGRKLPRALLPCPEGSEHTQFCEAVHVLMKLPNIPGHGCLICIIICCCNLYHNLCMVS